MVFINHELMYDKMMYSGLEERRNPEFITEDSPTQRIYSKVVEGLKKVPHSEPIDFKKGNEEHPPFGVVIGNVTRDAELRTTNSGKSVANTSVAVNLGAKHLNYVLGTSFADDETIFIEVTGWEKTADIMAKANITKGSQVAFTGSLALEEYQDKQRIRLNVSRFQILKRKGDAVGQNNAPADQPEDDLPF